MSYFSVLSVINDSIIDDLGLNTVINAVIVGYERDKIVPQVNVILATRNISPVKDIPDLLRRFYGIDYYGALSAIRLANKPVSCLGSKDYNIYLKNKKLIDSMMFKGTTIEVMKEFCFRKGVYTLKEVRCGNKVTYKKTYVPDQVVRKIFLLRRGDSGNPDMEEETRIDRIKSQKTPPPMSQAQINRVVTINCMFESKINAMGVGFEDLDNTTQSRWRNYVENAVITQKDKANEFIVDKFLQDTETKSRVLKCVRVKEEKLIKLFVKNVIRKYIQENNQMKKILTNKFKDYVKNLNPESKTLLARNNYEMIIHTFCQNLNQSV